MMTDLKALPLHPTAVVHVQKGSMLTASLMLVFGALMAASSGPSPRDIFISELPPDWMSLSWDD